MSGTHDHSFIDWNFDLAYPRDPDEKEPRLTHRRHYKDRRARAFLEQERLVTRSLREDLLQSLHRELSKYVVGNGH